MTSELDNHLGVEGKARLILYYMKINSRRIKYANIFKSWEKIFKKKNLALQKAFLYIT